MRQEIQIVQKLWELVFAYKWVGPVIIILGFLASLAEGIGITLMIPLLKSIESNTFQAAAHEGLINLIQRPFLILSPKDRVAIIAVAITVAILIKNALFYTNKALFSWFNQEVGNQLRGKIFQQLLNIQYTYFQKKDSGELFNLLATESWQVSRALEILLNIIISLCTLIVFTILLLLMSWHLMVLIIILNFLISVIVQKVTNQAKNLGTQAVKLNSQLSALMYEGLIGMQTIRAFGRENYEQKRFETALGHIKKIFWKLELLYGLVDPLHESLSTLLVIGVLLFSLLRNPSAISAILTFMFMLYRLQPHIKLIDSYRVNLLATEGAIDAVSGFITSKNKPYPVLGYLPFSGLKEGIAFQSVSFYYPECNLPALKKISLQIPSGQTTALVGPSGAGKSTLINLVCRFYEAMEGEIKVDGVSLQALNRQQWREQIAIVSQDIHIFSATIRENIAYGRLDASEDEIITAARQAHAHEFISQLELGYGTPVGNRGLRLSGGQRQRLALARAIIRNPEILILDEATNALDTLSENFIQEALARFSDQRTAIVIAHRLSTIEKADQIIVLNQGEIEEQGTLQELLNNQGLFHQLYQLQYHHALPYSGT